MTSAEPVPAQSHIVVEDIRKRFGDREVLAGVSLVVRRGETAVILGGSGAGKTTLVRLLIGLDKPDAGRILVDGQDIVPMRDVQMNEVRRRFGMVFQYAALLDSLTVFDNLAFPLREHTRLRAAEIRDRVRDKLRVLGLEGTEDLYPAELSGGMRKRVGVARALMLEPRVLIYDEPTSGLDPTTSRRVDDLIEDTRRRFGVTSVVISHDMASAFRIAHTVFVLKDGRIVAQGAPEDLANGGAAPAAREFLEASGVAVDRLRRAGDG